jgi:ankyrin repeat protein
MSQVYDVDGFVVSAEDDTFAPKGVTTAVTGGIPVNGRHSASGCTALHRAVAHTCRNVVVALLAEGADANVKDNIGRTSMWSGAACSTAVILQLLIDGGGSVNESDNYGQTPLIALVRFNKGDAAERLQVLLAYFELELDAAYKGMTAEEWAVGMHRLQLASVISQERDRRKRWSALRFTWIAATIAPTVTPSIV